MPYTLSGWHPARLFGDALYFATRLAPNQTSFSASARTRKCAHVQVPNGRMSTWPARPTHRLPWNGAHGSGLTKCRWPDLPSVRRANQWSYGQPSVTANLRAVDKWGGSRQRTESGSDGSNHGMDNPPAHRWAADQWPPSRGHHAKSRTKHRMHGAAIKRSATVPWDHPCPPDPVMVQVHTMPKPPCGMVHLIPRRHPGTPPDEVGLVGNHRWWRPVFERQRQNAVRRQRIPWTNVIRTVQPAIASPVVIKAIIGIDKAGGRGQVVGVDTIPDGKREVDLRGGSGSGKCPGSTEQQKPKQRRGDRQHHATMEIGDGRSHRRHPHPRHAGWIMGCTR